MINSFTKKGTVILLLTFFILSSCIPSFGSQIRADSITESINELFTTASYNTKYLEIELSFSDPNITQHGNYSIVHVNETNHNRMILFDMDPGKPVLPVNLSVFELSFGTKIIDVEYEHSTPEIIDLPAKIAFAKASYDNIQYYLLENKMDVNVYENDDPYPSDWVSYRTGGGLSQDEHVTFLVLRIYPVRYYPADDQLQFIQTITVNITYEEPVEPLLDDNNRYDLLILAPCEFMKHLQPLVCHKSHMGVKTRLESLQKVYKEMYWHGRDRQEKIKYYIKTAVEEWGIKHVLLVGGIKGQTVKWNLPARYSYVVPMEEQEYSEQSFISDLYYADIYDGEGGFSSWDSNGDDLFSVWNLTFKEDMDLYPDVYLGRLPCRNIAEVKVMVNKIIKYEKEKSADSWFKNLILVAGDSYPDVNGFNEGELISERAVELMPSFNPVRVYACENQDIDRKTVNAAMNQGAGFAYFCGHGSSVSWSTHFPPDGKNWTTGYNLLNMIPLHNKGKLPVTVVGGCHNGEFDISITKSIKNGLKENGLKYFIPKGVSFWWNGWAPNCWAWWLTSKPGGGAIATIANTGLGTHGDDDVDNNSVADYLEVLDGWLELRFLELYGTEQKYILGENHAQTITEYMHRFLGDEAIMDTKMVQQWELFGDPSLKIGGYE